MKLADLPTRDRIRSAAETLFAAHGFGGVSLRTLAMAAGVPLGGIAYHFGSKEGLYRAIWEHWMGGQPDGPRIDQTPSRDPSSREDGLRRLIEAFFAGPRAILREDRGHLFIAIMVREAHDPEQARRGLMEAFVRPNGERTHAALAELMPELAEETFEVGFHMTLSALRIVIENDRSPHPLVVRTQQDFDRLFSIITDFVVQGWLGLISR